VRSILVASIIILSFLSACSDPSPESYAEFYDDYKEKNGVYYNYILVGPDVRWATGKIRKDVIWDKRFRAHGFVWFGHKDPKEAKKIAIDNCEQAVGKYECYVYVKGNDYVRLVERKKWLAQNSAARQLIAKEKDNYQKTLQRSNKSSLRINLNTSVDLTNLTNSVMNGWRAPYEKEMSSILNNSSCSSSVDLTNLTNSVMNGWRAPYKKEMSSLLSCSGCSSSVDLTNLTNSVMNGWRASYKKEMNSLLNCLP